MTSTSDLEGGAPSVWLCVEIHDLDGPQETGDLFPMKDFCWSFLESLIAQARWHV